MKTYLYLSLVPEALIASHLPPEEFGSYISVGSQKRSRGQAMYFKLTDAYAEATLKKLGMDNNLGRTVGEPLRRSAYLKIYRVLEETPLNALETLHLTTDDGRVLSLKHGNYQQDLAPRFHLYQELCPVSPRIISTLEPKAFAQEITDASKPISLPALVYTELKLEGMAEDPEAKGPNLPYTSLEHMRDCMREIRAKPNKKMKTVVRNLHQDLLYRTLRGGFYVAAPGGGFVYFPMPSREELESTYYSWWRSALSSFGG
jgi:hypothetical protein